MLFNLIARWRRYRIEAAKATLRAHYEDLAKAYGLTPMQKRQLMIGWLTQDEEQTALARQWSAMAAKSAIAAAMPGEVVEVHPGDRSISAMLAEVNELDALTHSAAESVISNNTVINDTPYGFTFDPNDSLAKAVYLLPDGWCYGLAPHVVLTEDQKQAVRRIVERNASKGER